MGENMDELLVRIDQKQIDLEKRVISLESERAAIQEMARNSAVTDAKLSQIITKVDDINVKVESLEKRPGKRWDSLMVALIGALVGAIVTMFLHY